jgi:hypothetical protein
MDVWQNNTMRRQTEIRYRFPVIRGAGGILRVNIAALLRSLRGPFGRVVKSFRGGVSERQADGTRVGVTCAVMPGSQTPMASVLRVGIPSRPPMGG